MPASILRRLLGRAGGAAAESVSEAFSLPGSLQPGARVLLLASDDLTDLLFSMPLVDALHATVTDLKLGLLCDERTSHLALSTSRFSDVIVVDEEHLRSSTAERKGLERVLGDEPWDVAILLGRDPDPNRDELAFLSGARLRVGPDHPRAYPHLNCEVRPPASDDYPYGRSTTWGRLLGLALDDSALAWPIDPKRQRQMQQLVHFNKPRKQQRLIGIDPGVSKGGSRLGTTNLALIANHLVRTIDSRSMLLSAEAGTEAIDELRPALSSAPLDLPRPTLLETILLLTECDLFVCGNTDLLHFAAALGVGVLALFPESEAEVWVPARSSRCEIVRLQTGAALDLAELMDRVERILGA